jgi:hypothetical protein
VTVDVEDFQRFQGGRSWMARAGIVGAIGLVAALIGLAKDPQPAAFSYLVAFTYWAGVAIMSLLWVMIFHAFHAKWMTVIRRPFETMASTLPLFALLFIPVIVGLVSGHLYSWTKTPEEMGLNAEQVHMMHNKAGWLNVPFFIGRSVFYLVLCSFLAQRLWSLSTKQDSTGDIQLTVAQRRLSVGGLPFLALVVAFAAFDWLMSLNPLWFSTMFGVYYFAGGFLTAMSLVSIINTLAVGKDNYGPLVTPEHSHNVGKLMFAFTCFWTYIGFSQFMLIWIANLPEETPFFSLRMSDPWKPVSILLIVTHFFIPFLTLLSRKLKRHPRLLRIAGFWLLAVNFLDLYWLVMPTFSPDKVVFPLWLLPAWLGVGGLAIAFGIWRIRGHYAVPVKDPFLSVSLRYRQP